MEGWNTGAYERFDTFSRQVLSLVTTKHISLQSVNGETVPTPYVDSEKRENALPKKILGGKDENMIKKIAAIFLLLFFSIGSISHPEEAVKKYPPYPDVWGVELPVSENVHHAGIDILKMDDGDYMVKYISDFQYLKSRKERDFDFSKHTIIKFAGYSIFGSKRIEIGSGAEYNHFMEKARKEGRLLDYRPVTFSDGSIIEQIDPGPGSAKGGDNPIDWYFERRDKNGKVLFQKKFLYIYDKPRRDNIRMSEKNFDYKGKYYFERVNPPAEMKCYRLEDDTFIVVGLIEHKKPKSIVVIRFDKDIKTKSNLINKKLFLMDESIYRKMQSPPIDDNKAHKLLYEYLIKNK